MISTVFFPRMIDSFHEISDTPIQLYEFGSVRALSMVKSGELDLAIVNLDFYDKDNFNYHVLMEDKTIYCVSRSHPYAKETAVTIDMLKDEAVIFLNTDSVQNQTINLRYRNEGLTPNVILYSSQLYTTLNFIRGGNLRCLPLLNTGCQSKRFCTDTCLSGNNNSIWRCLEKRFSSGNYTGVY